jgi:hypothetical protein
LESVVASSDVKQVGRELGVCYVLEGSVRKVRERVRITVQLIETQTGTHLWAERYDRLLDDIFALQDEIAISAIGGIEPSLRRSEEVLLPEPKRPRNSERNPGLLGAWEKKAAEARWRCTRSRRARSSRQCP